MNKKRFSDLELYTIRNNIPVQTVINNVLHIPAEKSGKYLRFQCPLCCGYNTAVKKKQISLDVLPVKKISILLTSL